MATFGQGINPQLGAIDYSPILRGSMAGAQMAAQGSQMIGQGLANLGQEVGKGIEKYGEQKKKNALRDGFVASSVKSMVSLSDTLRKAGDTSGADEAAASAHAIEVEPDLDKRYAMAQGGLQNYATIHQLGQQALGEKQKKESAAYYNYLLNGQKTDIMDGGMGAPQASEQSIAAANEMLLNRRYKESQIAHQNAAAGSVAATAGIAETKRQAAIYAGRVLGGIPLPDNLDPAVRLEATNLINEAGSKAESLKALKKTAADHAQYATDSVNDLAKPRIETIGGDQVLVLHKLGGGFEYKTVSSTDVQKIQEQATATKEILRQYHASGANSNARFVAGAALLKLNPSLAQFGGIMGLDELLKDTNTAVVDPAAPATAAPISISSISPSTARATPPAAPAASAAPLASSNQPADVLSPEFSAAAALSAANNNPPAYRNGTPVGQSTGSPAVQNAQELPSAPSGYGQDARGEPMPTVQPQAQTARPVAPSATLTDGAANVVKSSVAQKFVNSASSTASSVSNNANELYLAAEIGNAILNDPILKADVKGKLGNLLSKVFTPKVRALARLSPKTAKYLLSGTTKVAGQLVRPAMMVNSLDNIVGKYVGKSFPEQETTRATQAAASVLALWAESSTDNKKDEEQHEQREKTG